LLDANSFLVHDEGKPISPTLRWCVYSIFTTRPGVERTPEVLQGVIDRAPHAPRYYPDAALVYR
jgi:hypothetical protein